MKRLLAVTLGILTAIGGFVDIGDLVASSLVGARFGFSLVWVLLVGVVGIRVYAWCSASARRTALTRRSRTPSRGGRQEAGDGNRLRPKVTWASGDTSIVRR